MLIALIEGIGCGVMLAFMLGPVFFGLLQTTLSKGFKAGVLYAIGVAASDFTCIVLSYLGIASFINNTHYSTTIKLTGSFILCVFGIVYLFKKPFSFSNSDEVSEKLRGKKSILLKGYLLNIMTPSVLLFWAATMGFVSAEYGNAPNSIICFFAGCLGSLLTTDLFKSYLAQRIRGYLNERMIGNFQKLVGLVFLVAGSYGINEYLG